MHNCHICQEWCENISTIPLVNILHTPPALPPVMITSNLWVFILIPLLIYSISIPWMPLSNFWHKPSPNHCISQYWLRHMINKGTRDSTGLITISNDILLEGNEWGHLQIYYKLCPMQKGKGKITNVSITDNRYTRSTLWQVYWPFDRIARNFSNS